MNRKQFLELSKAIIGGLVMHSELSGVAADQSPAGSRLLDGYERDDFYLVRGLTGMARANGWFDAHWGAAVLAGHYLCRENHLGAEITAAIKKQLDAMIMLREAQFTPFPPDTSDRALIEKVPEALGSAIRGGLRAHGHAVIFASLSTRALRDAPHLAQPKLIQGLSALSGQIAKIKAQKPPGEASYANTQAMIDGTFLSLVRFRQLLGRPAVRRPNFTHMITHTEALMNLESMGYRDLMLAGQAGHRAHIAAPVPEFDPARHPQGEHRAKLEDLMTAGFWSDAQNVDRWKKAWNESSNPNGYWVAFGHLFKVLYSYHRLIARVKDQEQVRLCSMILLERYINPAVQGG